MPKFKLISYNDREIKTQEDMIWVCKEVTKAYESGNVQLKDRMALAYLEMVHQEHIDEGCFGIIENRFEILDL